MAKQANFANFLSFLSEATPDELNVARQLMNTPGGAQPQLPPETRADRNEPNAKQPMPPVMAPVMAPAGKAAAAEIRPSSPATGPTADRARDIRAQLDNPPAAPKQTMNSFMYFLREKRPERQAQHPELSTTEINRLLGKEWDELKRTDPDGVKKMRCSVLAAQAQAQALLARRHHRLIAIASRDPRIKGQYATMSDSDLVEVFDLVSTDFYRDPDNAWRRSENNRKKRSRRATNLY